MLTRRFQVALKEDRRSKIRRAGEEIETLVLNDQVREAWSKKNGGTKRPRDTKYPPPVSSSIKPQPCGKTSTGNILRRTKELQS